MNLKQFSRLIVFSALILFVASCNSDNEITYGKASSDAQIRTFTVGALPYTATDTLLYPTLAAAKFSILNKGTYFIFNNDSLPKDIDIRTLHVALSYSSSPSKVELIYQSDSIADWNTSDSVKFIRNKTDNDDFYPRFRVQAPDGTTRTYTVEFRIHKIDPEAISWEAMTAFFLQNKGENKTLISADSTDFYSLLKANNNISFGLSKVATPSWTWKTTTLPSNIVVKSLHQFGDKFAVMAEDGKVFSSTITDAITNNAWTEHSTAKVQSIVGILPEISKTATALNELLVTYYDDANVLKFGKISDFNNPIEDLTLVGRSENSVPNEFPIKSYSSLSLSENILVTSGYDKNNKLIKKSWTIRNISLANATANKLAEINIFPGANDHIVPYTNGVTTFVYNNSINALASYSLYTSQVGDVWAKPNTKKIIAKEMEDNNMPSIVVDKENYIWVFGGVSSKSNTFSQDVWRGRLNKLIPEKK